MAKNFISDCKKVLSKKQFLYMAFQTNALSDSCYSSDNFKESFENMIKVLEEELDFFIPKMFMNMRNSREIVEVAKTIETTEFHYKIANIIDYSKIWKSSITSYLPTLIPILKEDFDHNYTKLFGHATENGRLNVILFSGQDHLDLKKIKKAVLKCDVEKENVLIHTFDSNHSKEDIKMFLSNQKGFLICQEELFTGMEAKSVVYCLADCEFRNIRVNIMRACS